ncbi:protein YLS3 [Cajanus cajan]|uniref:GPI-anchored protein At1g27950 family n=1 Tax=Cajanus cajan TaxID=3821 RepID=A0A151QZQ6_CAJCA|nr:protein YLS3 [Cajanus cajan]KYP35705.1 putative GPI-anchored protein At1g27950 family [Cajanus cajan]
MGSKGNLALSLAMFLLFLGFATSDINQDKAECTDKLLGLAGCLPYATSQSKVPTPDCCSGLKVVIDKSKRCLCILINDRDDPNLGIKINVTLALNLPTVCHTPTNITQCIDLLHLAPNSKEAKVFEGFQKALSNKTDSTPSPSVSNNATSQGTNNKSGSEWGKRWLVADVVLPFILISHLFLFVV